MSVRSHFEINHDTFEINASDAEIAQALRSYVRSASHRNAERLRSLGLTRFWYGHHSEQEVINAAYSRKRTEPDVQPAPVINYVELAAELAHRSAST